VKPSDPLPEATTGAHYFSQLKIINLHTNFLLFIFPLILSPYPQNFKRYVMESFVSYLEKTVPDRLQRKFIEKVANSTPDIIYVMDLQERKIIFINDRVSSILGYDPELFYTEGSKIFAKKLHPDDYLKRMQYITDCLYMTEDQTKTIDVRLHAKNGSWRWFRIRDIPFKIENGIVLQTVGVARDIHELKLAEEKMRYNELLLRSAINLIPNPVQAFKAVRNEKGEIADFEWIIVNEASRNYFDNIVGKHLTRKYPGIIESGLFEKYKKVVETGRPLRTQLHYHYDGLNLWLDIYAAKMNDGFVVVTYDLDQKERIEKAAIEKGFVTAAQKIKVNEEKFKALLESAPDAMVIVDETGTINIVNTQLEKLFGYDREELLGKKIEFLIPDRFHGAHKDYRNHFFVQPKTRGMGEGRELFARRSDGKEIPVEISLSPLLTDEGLLISAAIRDRTLQRELQQTALEYEKLSAMGIVSRTIAHEIRNPLTNIALAVQMLQEENENNLLDSNRLTELTEMISRNSARVDHLLKDLLYRSLPGEVNLVTVDLMELIAAALEIASDRILLKTITVEKRIEQNCFIKADVEQIKIALLNIIINAVEAMESQTGKLRITGYSEKNKIFLSIEDNGSGISKDQLHKIFEPNFSTKASGLGIGLANVKTILDRHGAQFEITSKLNKGTKFSIVFDPAT
jgi:two-component system, sporulation sensor kinase E